MQNCRKCQKQLLDHEDYCFSCGNRQIDLVFRELAAKRRKLWGLQFVAVLTFLGIISLLFQGAFLILGNPIQRVPVGHVRVLKDCGGKGFQPEIVQPGHRFINPYKMVDTRTQ